LRTACSRGAKNVDHERHATIIREAVQPLTGSAQDYDSLLALIGETRFDFARRSFARHARVLARARGGNSAQRASEPERAGSQLSAASSRPFRLPRAWDSTATLANGRSCCGLAIENRLNQDSRLLAARKTLTFDLRGVVRCSVECQHGNQNGDGYGKASKFLSRFSWGWSPGNLRRDAPKRLVRSNDTSSRQRGNKKRRIKRRFAWGYYNAVVPRNYPVAVLRSWPLA
jgi:hypothetical protein